MEPVEPLPYQDPSAGVTQLLEAIQRSIVTCMPTRQHNADIVGYITAADGSWDYLLNRDVYVQPATGQEVPAADLEAFSRRAQERMARQLQRDLCGQSAPKTAKVTDDPEMQAWIDEVREEQQRLKWVGKDLNEASLEEALVTLAEELLPRRYRQQRL